MKNALKSSQLFSLFENNNNNNNGNIKIPEIRSVNNNNNY